MSSIKNTHIEGNVSVGRKAFVGGDVSVQGHSLFKGNVRIAGWLNAKNLDVANKGLFTTAEKLRMAYPEPQDGWLAIVGQSLPGAIYVGDGGEWVATGGTGGNPTIESEHIEDALSELLLQQEEIVYLRSFIDDYMLSSIVGPDTIVEDRVGFYSASPEFDGTVEWSILQSSGGEQNIDSSGVLVTWPTGVARNVVIQARFIPTNGMVVTKTKSVSIEKAFFPSTAVIVGDNPLIDHKTYTVNVSPANVNIPYEVYWSVDNQDVYIRSTDGLSCEVEISSNVVTEGEFNLTARVEFDCGDETLSISATRALSIS